MGSTSDGSRAPASGRNARSRPIKPRRAARRIGASRCTSSRDPVPSLSRRARLVRAAATLAAGLFVLAGADAARAAALRYQINQKGDFVLLGNTLGQNCGPGVPAPVVGNVGACGSNTADTAPDIFWRSDDATGTASAGVP